MENRRTVTLASGRVFDPSRPRSHGVLDREEVEYCRAAGIPLGYDPAQNGWVPMSCEDDFQDPRAALSSATAAPPSAAKDVAESVARFRPAVREAAAAVADLSRAGTETRLTFRKWRPSDAGAYRAFLDNPKLWRFLPETPPSPFTEEVALALIEASQVASHHEVLAVELGGAPVGQVRLLFDRSYPGLEAAEVSYWIGEEHWGKGLGAEVLRELTLHAFRSRPLDLIYAWIRLDNAASIKTAERAGYRRDPFAALDAAAKEPRREGCGRWLRFRSECLPPGSV